MSAFVVSFRHIDTILNYAAMCQFSVPINNGWLEVSGNEQQIGEILFAENLRSVKYRYSSNARIGESHDYSEAYKHSKKPAFVGKVPSAIGFIKLLDCLNYQACECSDYNTTPTCKIINSLQSQATSKIPGYDAAEWCLDEYEQCQDQSSITDIFDL